MNSAIKPVDLAIVGAGPAGLAAAAIALQHGASVLLLDEQSNPGGQIYRNLEINLATQNTTDDSTLTEILGADYLAGLPLLAPVRQNHDKLEYVMNAVVWQVDVKGNITYSRNGHAQRCKARHIVIATGAVERPVPTPGWTLPGVMTVGAAQILLKTSALVPENTVLVGSGPLLYLFAQQMIKADAAPIALVETQSMANYFKALRHLPAALMGWQTIAKGLRLLQSIRAARVPRFTAASDIAIHGNEAVSHLTFKQGSTSHQLECSSVLLHQGVVPNTQMSRALGFAHHWNEQQRCFHPVLSSWGESECSNVTIAGDGAGILGGQAAALTGKAAGLNALYRLGAVDENERNKLAQGITRDLNRERAPRAFLDVLYSPAAENLQPADDVTVCRCEEVTAGDIRSYAALGCVGPNQTKAFGRCGMGPCQGRYCALTVTELLAAENSLHPSEVGSYRIRSPIKPVTLGELASLSDDTVPQ